MGRTEAPLRDGQASPTAEALLTVAEMRRADALAIAGGVSGIALMEAAGAGVVRSLTARWKRRPVLVLCGPGNNGGDGFVVARLLRAAGWPVHLAATGPVDRLQGDAAIAAKSWCGPSEPLDPTRLKGYLDTGPLVVDGLFGAGLTRPLEGAVLAMVAEVTRRRLPLVAIDVPSGVDGDTGAVLGGAFQADLTVTFFRRKPGHLLLPGRLRCGTVELVDIGIPERVLAEIRPSSFRNDPALWRRLFPWPAPDCHKHRRGHALVVGGGRMTGAARLAARAAQRVGAGLVTLACPAAAMPIYATALASALIEPADDLAAFAALCADRRRSAILIGPGLGTGPAGRAQVLAALGAGRPCVLDADALTAFAGEAETLLVPVRGGGGVLTPHDGEYARLFGFSGDRLTRGRAAAALAGAVVVLKGADTVIAAADGRAALNDNAPPWLATAGSGDTLAGVLVGLIAQGMPAFEAAAAATWLHGAAAADFGPGLIAEDLAEALPKILSRLWQESDGRWD